MFDPRRKIFTLEQIALLAEDLKQEGKRAVAIHGCFDIIHPGHTRTLAWARKQGDVLIAGIDSDELVCGIKGSVRPINNEHDRAYVLAALASVDFVFISKGNPVEWIPKLQPDVYVKKMGSQFSPEFAAEEKLVEENGGGVLLAPFIRGFSSAEIAKRILAE